MQNVLSFVNCRACRRRLLRRRFFDPAGRKWIRMEWNGPRCVEIARRYVDGNTLAKDADVYMSITFKPFTFPLWWVMRAHFSVAWERSTNIYSPALNTGGLFRRCFVTHSEARIVEEDLELLSIEYALFPSLLTRVKVGVHLVIKY